MAAAPPRFLSTNKARNRSVKLFSVFVNTLAAFASLSSMLQGDRAKMGGFGFLIKNLQTKRPTYVTCTHNSTCCRLLQCNNPTLLQLCCSCV
eukprot:m.225084 g.225084  ORF g.225084 m.225084 type:complete len:92 (-) comp15157_c2_seq6:127-402(-)